MVFGKGSMVLGKEELLFGVKMGLQGGGAGPAGFWRLGRGVIEVRSGSGGILPVEDPARTRGGSRVANGRRFRRGSSAAGQRGSTWIA
jgi:hypothetical protein